MSGPYCKECKHYEPSVLSPAEGNCGDPSKIIITKGVQDNEKPFVQNYSECSSWVENEKPQSEERGS